MTDKAVSQSFAQALERANSALEAIGDYAHDKSTGPAVWDPLWEVRRMAYEGVQEALSIANSAPAIDAAREQDRARAAAPQAAVGVSDALRRFAEGIECDPDEHPDTRAAAREALCATKPEAPAGPGVSAVIHESRADYVHATLTAPKMAEYTLEATREDGEDWHITVTAENGMRDYLGYWEDSESKTVAGVLVEAAHGACLGQLAAPAEDPANEGGALDDMTRRKDAAYLERNQVVAALAHAYPSGIARTAIEGWSEDWHGCVYIDLPTGQASWHYHDSHAHLFGHLPPYAGSWDGHTTEQKYERLAALAAPAQGAAVPADAVLQYLDDLQDEAAAHIWPDDLRKCMTSECAVEVASVRMGSPDGKTVPLFSREQVDAALRAARQKGGV